MALVAGALVTLPSSSIAQGTSKAKALVMDAVASCAQSVVENPNATLQLFRWPDDCQKSAHDNCRLSLLTDADLTNDATSTQTCQAFEAEAWHRAGEGLRQHLADRWLNCTVSDTVKSEMIGKIERLSSAFDEMIAAQCDYEAGQWAAVQQPDIQNQKLSSCLVGSEVWRAREFYMILLKDVGCSPK